MASEITLSAAVRSSLLSLTGTEKLIARTQERLASGLRIASPLDDARTFFEAKVLNDRAGDLNEKKDGIDQAISSVSAALEAVETVDSIVRQAKGLAIAAKSASGSELVSLQDQYNELLTQIDNLTSDATYAGLNLIDGTGQSLDVSFSTDSNSSISIASVDLTTASTGLSLSSIAGFTAAAQSVIDLTITSRIGQLDGALDTLRANAAEIGSNVALLQTRLDFTERYVNVLEEGSGKLTLADISEEGANLVALQTRQQLGISSLAFAGQSEQSVLALFR